ncbi:MAG: hypothetical protein ABSH36_01850 [Solirubrobacteraceae bacterium]
MASPGDDPDRVDVPEIAEFDAAMEAVNDVHAAALPAVRSLALQRDAADAYDGLVQEAARLKAKVVERGDEDSAARLLCGECVAGALMSTLRLWIAFKEGDMSTAWNRTVDAQVAWTGALRAHPIGAQFRRLAVVPFQVEHVLFPHIAFMSTGMIVRKSECTICGETPGECDHIRGHVYGGKFAGILVTEAEPREVSIVDVPADKRCRVEQITSDDVTRDALTWEVLKTANGADEVA